MFILKNQNADSGRLRQPQVPESIARGKPLGYRTYFLCKTAFLLHMCRLEVLNMKH